jgi:hypothetical protein
METLFRQVLVSVFTFLPENLGWRVGCLFLKAGDGPCPDGKSWKDKTCSDFTEYANDFIPPWKNERTRFNYFMNHVIRLDSKKVKGQR